MTYPGNHLRLVVSGPIFSGTERFSWGVALKGAPGSPAPTTVTAAVRDAVAGFHSSVSGTTARVDLIKLNEIGPDGRYVNSETVMLDLADAPIAGQSGAVHAPQVALAITLDSGVRRGLAARGRFFIPAPRQNMDTTGRMSTEDQTYVAGSALTFVEALNAAVPEHRVCIASDTREGMFRQVRFVRVGRVFDTIRSRRTSLPEEHVATADVAGYPAFGGDGGTF